MRHLRHSRRDGAAGDPVEEFYGVDEGDSGFVGELGDAAYVAAGGVPGVD